MKRFRAIAALFLLACWVPISSHELLETWGLIHIQASNCGDKHEDGHDAADGLCQLLPQAFQVQRFVRLQVVFVAPIVLSDLISESVAEAEQFGLVNPSPPDIPVGWQFSVRAALPVRAPSFGS